MDGVQQTQRAHSVHFGRVLGQVKGNFDVTLGSLLCEKCRDFRMECTTDTYQMVDFRWLKFNFQIYNFKQ